MSEAVIKAVRKARAEHKKTPVGRLQSLRKERSRWLRKQSIAQNKLKWVQHAIDLWCEEQIIRGPK